MKYVDDLRSEPWRFDFFNVMRRLERSFKGPRIGESASVREDYVKLGQDPFMEFPASNLSKVEGGGNAPLRVYTRFLGLLGPQGALPYSTTEEAYGWWLSRDDAFARFLDLFNHRFLQLFFRAWANSRPIAQHDRPTEDRFKTYIAAMIGAGSEPFRNLDSVPDDAKCAFAGIMGAQAKSASRLRSVIAGLFGVKVEIDQFVGSRLTLGPGEVSRIGAQNCALGVDAMAGGTFFSLQDKFRIRIYTETLADYVSFLPGGSRRDDKCEQLADLVFFYVGEQLDWDVELAIAAGAVAPVKLGEFGQLGWTTWMSPNWTSKERYRTDSRFHPAERVKQKRRAKAAAQAA